MKGITAMMVMIAIMTLGSLVMVSCDSENGIQTLTLPVDSDPTVAFRIWFKAGSQNDPQGKEGLAALTASLMTNGSTENRGYSEILEALYPMAAGYGASVDKEMTVITGRVHKDHVDAYMDLLMDAILHPAFLEEDFNRIKTNTLNFLEKTMRYSNDEMFGKETFYRMIFEGTPYGHPEAGLIESVRSITLDHVKQFYKTYFTRDNVIIGIGGGYDKPLIQDLKSRLSALPPKVVPPVPPPDIRPLEGQHVTLVQKNTRSTAISFGFPIDVKRGDRDFYALWLANSWLGEHRNSSSHLYQVIRETRGLNYGDYSYIEVFPNGWARQFPPVNVGRRRQVFEVWIRPVPNEAAHFSLRAAVREIQKLIDEGMSPEDFELTREFLKKYILHYAPTTSTRLGYKMDDHFYGIKDHLKTMEKTLGKLTLEEVNDAIRRHLQTENMAIAMITDNTKELSRALINNTPSPLEYSTPKPPEVLEEDREIAVYPLNIQAGNVTLIPADDMFLK